MEETEGVWWRVDARYLGADVLYEPGRRWSRLRDATLTFRNEVADAERFGYACEVTLYIHRPGEGEVVLRQVTTKENLDWWRRIEEPQDEGRGRSVTKQHRSKNGALSPAAVG